MSDCLGPSDFSRYHRGEWDATEAERIRTHIDSCETCRAAYAEYLAKQEDSSDQEPLSPSLQTLTSDTLTQEVPSTKVARHIPTIEGYRITGVLGQGGMGIVYQAVQTKLNRAVALKVLPAIVSTANPAAVSRFKREATAAARLHHTNIIPIYDFGESRDGYYYAMEVISGHPLNVLIQHLAEHNAATASPARLAQILTSLDLSGPLDGASHDGSTVGHPDSTTTTVSGRGRVYHRQVARWMADAADALHYAHSQGIVHRDIKPSNLIMSMDGRIMIADFGLAKTAEEGSVTMTGAFLGTLRYVSPEQAMAKRVRVDHRTDIYSLGATMYELLCFQPAFPGSDDKEVLGAIIARDPVHPKKTHHAVPAELETICLKCLEKSKEARYGDARALADDLRNYMHARPIVARRPGPVSRTIKFVKRRRALVIGVAAAVLLPLAGLFSARQMAIRKEAEIERRAAEVQALCESGSYYSGKGKWDLAEAEWRRALELDPNHVATLLELAHMKVTLSSTMSEEDATKALTEVDELCAQILQIDPAEMRALAFQGVALKRLERYPEAIETLERTVELAPAAFASWSNLGALYAVTGDLVKGEENLRHGAELGGLEKDAYHAAVWRNYAALALHLRDPDTRTYISNAIECLEDDTLAWVLRARMRLQLEGETDAEEALADAKFADRLANERDGRAKRIRALAHLRSGQYEHAIKHAQLAMDLGDLKVANYLTMAVAEANLGNAQAARDRLAAAAATWPEDLQESGEFRATPGAGDLWFDSADELIRLREEAETAIAAASP